MNMYDTDIMFKEDNGSLLVARLLAELWEALLYVFTTTTWRTIEINHNQSVSLFGFLQDSKKFFICLELSDTLNRT